MSTDHLISIRQVTRRFGDVVALDQVTLDIEPNEFFALLGPSGCGKTTLLRILAGFETPDAGEVLLDGRDLVGVPPYRRPVNMMFQSYALFPHMNVHRNVAYGLEREHLPKAEVTQKVAAVLEMVGLGGLERRKPHQLSGGQRQRVALARAVVKEPRLLLLDEPLASLDKKIREDMEVELKRLQHEVGITFVLVTHDQEEAMSMADRVAVMEAGSIRQVASPVELYQRPNSLFVADFIGKMNVFQGRCSNAGVEVPGVGHLVADTTGITPGSVAHLTVRPENLTIHLGAPGAHLDNVLEGVVVDVSFVGGMTSCSVSVPGLAEAVVARVQGPVRSSPGDTVALSWSADQSVVLGG